jgi:hypothetical protein
MGYFFEADELPSAVKELNRLKESLTGEIYNRFGKMKAGG